MTNGDRIRQMSDEALAEECSIMFWDCGFCPIAKECRDKEAGTCKGVWLLHLKQEVLTDDQR